MEDGGIELLLEEFDGDTFSLCETGGAVDLDDHDVDAHWGCFSDLGDLADDFLLRFGGVEESRGVDDVDAGDFRVWNKLLLGGEVEGLDVFGDRVNAAAHRKYVFAHYEVACRTLAISGLPKKEYIYCFCLN